MKRRVTSYSAFALMALAMATACGKAPRDVIGESDMAQIIADLAKADSYMAMHPDRFADDSTKMALKQSVFARHGVDLALYDHSLEWYGHNMDVYTDVCDRAIRQLQDEKSRLERDRGKPGSEPDTPATGRPNEPDNLWQGARTWLLTPGMNRGAITWSMEPDSRQAGNKYQMSLVAHGNADNMVLTIAADYRDGSTTALTRPINAKGRSTVTLQTDTMRQVQRLYGHVQYDMHPGMTARIDSVRIVCTPLDRNTYGLIELQTTAERDDGGMRAKPSVMPDSHISRDRMDDEARAERMREIHKNSAKARNLRSRQK